MAKKVYARLIRAHGGDVASFDVKVRRKLAKVVKKYIELIRDRIRMSMRQPKTGRIYVFRGRKYRASAPGEAPAIRSGALYRAIVPTFSKSGLQARINPKATVKYAGFLEHGTRRNGVWIMRPRPYIKPGFDSFREAFLEDSRAAIRAAIKQSIKSN